MRCEHVIEFSSLHRDYGQCHTPFRDFKENKSTPFMTEATLQKANEDFKEYIETINNGTRKKIKDQEYAQYIIDTRSYPSEFLKAEILEQDMIRYETKHTDEAKIHHDSDCMLVPSNMGDDSNSSP